MAGYLLIIIIKEMFQVCKHYSTKLVCALQGKIKPKLLSSMLEALSHPETYITDHVLGVNDGGGSVGNKGGVVSDASKRMLTKLADLKEGVNSNVIVVVGVASVVPYKESIPQ